MAQKKVSKKKVKVDALGQVHIRATFNNIIISVTNMEGQVISWSSSGSTIDFFLLTVGKADGFDGRNEFLFVLDVKAMLRV